jgi:hypothetical protein
LQAIAQAFRFFGRELVQAFPGGLRLVHAPEPGCGQADCCFGVEHERVQFQRQLGRRDRALRIAFFGEHRGA